VRANEQLAALDGLIARKARKIEREVHELRALVRQRGELTTETTETEDTDGTDQAEEEEAAGHHAHAAAL
jgi:hypothetical protein